MYLACITIHTINIQHNIWSKKRLSVSFFSPPYSTHVKKVGKCEKIGGKKQRQDVIRCHHTSSGVWMMYVIFRKREMRSRSRDTTSKEFSLLLTSDESLIIKKCI
jgi:hypothetical protein